MNREAAMARIKELEEQVASTKEMAVQKLKARRAELDAANVRIKELERENEKLKAAHEELQASVASGKRRIATLISAIQAAAMAGNVLEQSDEPISGPQALAIMKELAKAFGDNRDQIEANRNEARLAFLAATAYVSGAGWSVQRKLPNRDKNACMLTGADKVRVFLADMDFAIEMHKRHGIAQARGLV